jgi:hypothetical protein
MSTCRLMMALLALNLDQASGPVLGGSFFFKETTSRKGSGVWPLISGSQKIERTSSEPVLNLDMGSSQKI